MKILIIDFEFMKIRTLLLAVLFISAISIQAQDTGVSPDAYRFVNTEMDSYAKKNIYEPIWSTHFDESSEVKYKKINNTSHLLFWLFTLYDAGDCIYLVPFTTQNDIEAYAEKYGKRQSDWRYTWAKSKAICKIMKAKGYDEFFTKHFKCLDMDGKTKYALAHAKSLSKISYDIDKDELVIVDAFDGKEYRGSNAASFLCSGELNSTVKERKEKIEAEKLRKQREAEENARQEQIRQEQIQKRMNDANCDWVNGHWAYKERDNDDTVYDLYIHTYNRTIDVSMSSKGHSRLLYSGGYTIKEYTFRDNKTYVIVLNDRYGRYYADPTTGTLSVISGQHLQRK